ncbi:rho GTPase-activating protein 4 isoform X2 [Alligator mississippiensis]|uniref:SLIT-ROBO Rho GTPase-activating protein 1 n=1 Tax=Alligator mississippiensis TaxID=8496 RepID=A0A151NDR5_ALLMI|nr:rho GTPase-activating protein 4 isoform X2 [Alligator mississippiensis]KYO34880.1 SLIT-ROBO Rho GTPase-activating protein 1 [Alligator mississippiensis]
MSTHGKLRKAEYDAQVKELRSQLGEQLRGLETQAEAKQQLLQDLGDFLRRKGELELEYGRGLERAAERLGARLREHPAMRRGDQDLPSGLQCCQAVLLQARQAGREHGALGEACVGPLNLALAQLSEDVGRLTKKAKELQQRSQEDLLAAVAEVQPALRTYQGYQAEALSAEAKLREAERQEEKRGGRPNPSSAPPGPPAGVGAKTPRRGSMTKGERLVEKRLVRAQEAQLKAAKARNDYLLLLGAANARLRVHFLHDLDHLLDCCDLGFHTGLARTLQRYMGAERRARGGPLGRLEGLDGAVRGLDPSGDKAKVMEANPNAYCLPPSFEYQPHEGDEVAEVVAEGSLRAELSQRLQQLQTRLSALDLENEELSKTLQATLGSLAELMGTEEHDGSELGIQESQDPTPTRTPPGKRRAQLQETESFYLAKLSDFLRDRSVQAKLESKRDQLQAALKRASAEKLYRTPQRLRCPRPLSQCPGQGFPSDLETFVQSTGEPIPLVVKSCIRYINLHGLQHEGIFRVPGSQVEVSELRNAFERGEDPLADPVTPISLDSVAGALKLFFRGLQPPLLPPELYNDLIATDQLPTGPYRLAQLHAVLSQLSAPTLVLLRYLFAFLNHLSQYSDENLMDAHNLAVCFGPALGGLPPGTDPVGAQPRFNAAVAALVLQPDAAFPAPPALSGPIYEKCMALHVDDGDCDSLQLEGVAEEGDAPPGTSPSALPISCDDPPMAPGPRRWWGRPEVNGARSLIPHTFPVLPECASPVDGEFKNPPTETTLEPSSRLRVDSSGTQGRGTSPGRRRITHFKELGHMPLSGGGRGGLHADRAEPKSSGDRQGLAQTFTEVDKAVSRHMTSVFQELRGRAALKPLGAPNSPPAFPKE